MSKHKSILSSLTALGASELPVTTNSVPRNSVLASVAAAGVSLLACQSADAGTIDVFTPNANVGFAAGDVNKFKLDIASLKSSGFSLVSLVNAGSRTLRFNTVGTNASDVRLRTTGVNSLATPGAYGKKFSQIGAGSVILFVTLEHRSVNGVGGGETFSQEYYAFSFTDDTSYHTHYGWIYGTLTGGYSNMNYNLISWAYDTTPNEQITMGQTQVSSSTPEPSTAALGAMAALILGAAGVRKWNEAKA
jgi:hypothetical protein